MRQRSDTLLGKLILVLSILVSAFLAVALAYILRDSVSTYVITPAVYAFRIARIIYEALPQAVWWVVFLSILTLVAVRNLLRQLRITAPPPELVREERPSRARLWSRWLEFYQKGDYSRWLLARNLSKLTLEIFAHQERQSLEQARERLLTGKIHLPPEVQAYIQIGLAAPSFRHYTDLLALLRSTRSDSPLDLDPERIIEYLETRTQIGGSL